MPSGEEVAAYQQATAAKYPSQADVWETLDGINLKILSTKDDKVQSIFIMAGLMAIMFQTFLCSGWMGQ
jgi:hypothetical protein